MNTDGTGYHTCKECHKPECLWNHTATDHKEGEQLEDRRNVVESSCNCGDGTDQRVQSLMFMKMMISSIIFFNVLTATIVMLRMLNLKEFSRLLLWRILKIITLFALGDMKKPKKIPGRIAGFEANTRAADFQLQSRLLVITPRRMFTWLSRYLKFGIFCTRKVWAQLWEVIVNVLYNHRTAVLL